MSSNARTARRAGGLALALLTALAALLPGGARADEGGWGIAGAFAGLGSDARGASLGGALAACVNDASAIHWNAARLVELDEPAVAVGFADLYGLGLVRQTAFQIAWPRRGRTFAWEAGRLQTGRQPAGSAIGLGLNASRVSLDPGSYAEYDLALAYARRAPWDLSWGLTGHALLVRADLEEVGATGLSVDLALARPFGPRLAGALVLRSLFSQLDWDNDRSESLVPTAQLSAALSLGRPLALPASLLWDLEVGRLVQASAGAEWKPRGEAIALRGGLAWRDDGEEARLQGALGAGVAWQGIRFDYGLALEREELGDTHRFSVHYRF